MNTKIILGACLSAFAVAVMTVPALAVKPAPALGKAKTATVMKVRGAKSGNKISAKGKATPIANLKKSK